jgi:hypothetical protein
MKRIVIGINLIITFLYAQNVVINEVLYDPVGPDSGFEWLELYNCSDLPVDLENWKIQKAGTSFTDVFTFPSITILPNGFLLIGEANVPDTDITTTLAFQNGGTETDGIRIVSADGSYTDTVLYDSPNSNNLPDDLHNPGIYFAPDVIAGNTLARKYDGIDTNNCETDFFECTLPTPGSSNFYPIDLALNLLTLTESGNVFYLNAEVQNLSTEYVDNSEAELEISINNTPYQSLSLPQLPPLQTIQYSCILGSIEEEYFIVKAFINYIYDNQLENNYQSLSHLASASPIILNEVFFKPQNTPQEWIEIYNRSSCGYLVDNWKIIDAAGGEIDIYGFLSPKDFLVVCTDELALQSTYPNLDLEKVIVSPIWTALNNTTESLIIRDDHTTVFDSLYYNGSQCPYDFSLERVNPFEDDNILWIPSIDSLGATPTRPNSVLPAAKDLELRFVDIWSEGNSLYHKLEIFNLGLNNIDLCQLICYAYRYDFEELSQIFEMQYDIFDTLEIVFSTSLPAQGYFRFDYHILAEEDEIDSNNYQFSFFNVSALPFVINEIMHAPTGGMPEWIEIKSNFPTSEMQHFYLIVDKDTLNLPFCAEEFFLVTSNSAAADTLRYYYDLNDVTILLGLPNLSNNGEELTLLDGMGNLIESFLYLPEWNLNQSGISIERVNSSLECLAGNWGPSVAGATPGKENSIYVQVLPGSIKFSVQPNPFSPYRGEHTIFTFDLPEIISRTTLRIFDLKGRTVNKLINQQLQSSNGSIVWNGRDQSGNILPIGVYIALLEVAGVESEKVYSQKTTVVIGK